MIRFDGPSLSFTLSYYMEIVYQWESCSSAPGFCVSLGERFFSQGIKEIDSTILRLHNLKMCVSCNSSYAFWYCKQDQLYVNLSFVIELLA